MQERRGGRALRSGCNSKLALLMCRPPAATVLIYVMHEWAFLLLLRRFYGEAIPGNVLAERVASYVHLFNLYWSLRCVELQGWRSKGNRVGRQQLQAGPPASGLLGTACGEHW